MFRGVTLLVLVTATCILGCSKGATTATAPNPTLEQVCQIVADLHGLERSRLDAETTLAEIRADELDYVELVMELEERFKITIPDAAAEKMMRDSNWQVGSKKVTMGQLATLVDERVRAKP